MKGIDRRDFVYVLLFRLNGVEYGIVLKYVCFIEKKKCCRSVGCTGEAGRIAMVRDNVVPVFNLALHFGYAEQEADYLVVVNVDDVKIALEVSSIDKAIWVEKERVKRKASQPGVFFQKPVMM